jgi:hypothetical protein
MVDVFVTMDENVAKSNDAIVVVDSGKDIRRQIAQPHRCLANDHELTFHGGMYELIGAIFINRSPSREPLNSVSAESNVLEKFGRVMRHR